MVETFTTFFFFFFFLPVFRATLQIAGALSQSSFKRELKLSPFDHSFFVTGLAGHEEKKRSEADMILSWIRESWIKPHQSVEKVEGWCWRWRLHLQRLCSTCRRLKTEPTSLIWSSWIPLNPAWIVAQMWLFKSEGHAASNQDKIFMPSANLEKQLRHKHTIQLHLEMRWVRLHSWLPPCFSFSASYFPALVYLTGPAFSFYPPQ